MKKVISVLVLVVLLAGCSGAKRVVVPAAGPVAPEAAISESESRLAHPGFYLNPHVVVEKQGEPEMPGESSPEVPGGLGGQPHVGDHWIDFKDAIRWNSSQNLFLVWNADVYGSAIVDGFFTHERKGVTGQKYSQGTRVNLGKDDSGRWFISIKKALDQALNEISSSDVHMFKIELHLQNTQQVVLSVSMSFLTAPAGLGVTQVPLPELPENPAALLRQFNQTGLVIEKTKYTNFSTRSVALWLRGTSDHVSVFTGLRDDYSIIPDNKNDRIVPARSDSKRETPAIISVDLEKDRRVTALMLNPLHWAKVEIAPSEEVTVNWKIIPEENLPVCKIRDDQMVEITIGECIGHCGQNHYQKPDQVRVSGMQLGGSIVKSVLLTDADISEPDLEFYASTGDASIAMQHLNRGFYSVPDPDMGIDKCVGLVQ